MPKYAQVLTKKYSPQPPTRNHNNPSPLFHTQNRSLSRQKIEKRIEVLREKRDREMKDIKPKPDISEKSKQIVENKRKTAGNGYVRLESIEEWVDRMSRGIEKNDHKMMKHKQEKLDVERGCTYSPQINATSKKIFINHHIR